MTGIMLYFLSNLFLSKERQMGGTGIKFS
uniref:Uncharacterized protein n=1 Tax=Rhizophora mucronata TaxID=61149 RepID=A0A2P2N0G7_RHIMU